MNKETLHGMLIALSRHGIDFLHSKTIPDNPVSNPKAFGKPFYPLQAHPIVELIWRIRGTPAICLNGTWILYTDDRIKVFTPGTWHTEHANANRDPYRILWCTISERSLMFHLTSYNRSRGYAASSRRLALTPPLVRRLNEVSLAPDLASSAMRQAEFHYLLMENLHTCIQHEASFPMRAADFHQHVMEHLVAHLNEHYWDDLDLTSLADMFHYSPKHLNTLFRKSMGTPLMNYLGDVRMQKARELLVSGTMLVKQAAEAVGIHDPLYFSRKFRRHFGHAPHEVITQRTRARQ